MNDLSNSNIATEALATLANISSGGNANQRLKRSVDSDSSPSSANRMNGVIFSPASKVPKLEPIRYETTLFILNFKSFFFYFIFVNAFFLALQTITHFCSQESSSLFSFPQCNNYRIVFLWFKKSLLVLNYSILLFAHRRKNICARIRST